MNPFAALVRPDAPQLVPAATPMPRPRPRQANPVRTFGGRFPALSNRWRLTPVECEIMRLTTEDGLTQREVAARLARSCKTIQTHCERIREKMGARNQYHAILLWDRQMRGNAVLLANLALQEIS
jgi:DNA-binding CsgD family transcriptional regulator